MAVPLAMGVYQGRTVGGMQGMALNSMDGETFLRNSGIGRLDNELLQMQKWGTDASCAPEPGQRRFWGNPANARKFVEGVGIGILTFGSFAFFLKRQHWKPLPTWWVDKYVRNPGILTVTGINLYWDGI